MPEEKEHLSDTMLSSQTDDAREICLRLAAKSFAGIYIQVVAEQPMYARHASPSIR